MKVKVALWGTGKRAHYYRDVLLQLSSDGLVEMVAVGSRSLQKARPFATALGCDVVTDSDALLEKQPDLVIISIPDPAKTILARRLISEQTNLFLDTPFAPTLSESTALLSLIKEHNVCVEIGENQAFSPHSELQKKVAQSRILGRALGAQNLYLEYYCHATTRFVSRNTSLQPPGILESRKIVFESGLTFEHFYTHPKDHPARSDKNWNVISENGSLSEKDAQRLDDRLQVKTQGKTFEVPFPKQIGDIPWTDIHSGIDKLLRRQIEVISGHHQQLHLGPERAHQGVALWRGMEAGRYLKGILTAPKWVHLVEHGRSLLGQLRR